MDLTIIKGQEQPELLGWRIYGESARPWPVPTFSWKADSTFTKAWVIQMQADEESLPLASVSAVSANKPGSIAFQVNRADGGMDHIDRRIPTNEEDDISIVSRNSRGTITARLDLNDGMESVAKPRGVPIGKHKPTISDRFETTLTAPVSEGIVLVNQSFESPALETEQGMFEGWETNSANGTGTWPVSRAGGGSMVDGKQVAVIRAGGFFGQVLKTEESIPVRIAPGARRKVQFRYTPHADYDSVNVGIYLHAGEGPGVQIAKAHSFPGPDENSAGEKEVIFEVAAKSSLDDWLPEGRENIPMYLKFTGFDGRALFDDIRVTTVP